MTDTKNPPADTFRNHIDGEWVPSRSGEVFANTNPADTSDLVGLFQASSAEDARAAVAAAAAAFESWRRTMSRRAPASSTMPRPISKPM